MLRRTLSTFALWAIVTLSLYFFNYQGAVVLLALLAALTQKEFYRLFRNMGLEPSSLVGCTVGFLLILSNLIPGFYSLDFLGFSVILVSIGFLIIRPTLENTTRSLLPTLAGIILIPMMLNYYVLLVMLFVAKDQATHGVMVVLWLIALAKFTDVGGLITGKFIGRHKLAPSLSPGKTWEGAIGGIAMSLAVGTAIIVLGKNYMPAELDILSGLIVGLPIAAISIVSDLMESTIKRQANVKDSGSMIPGIGGAFDLTDSLLMSGPVGYFVIKYWIA